MTAMLSPRGALLYGESGAWHVWHTLPTGMLRYDFSDEYLAMQFAVSVGSQATPNTDDL